MKEENVTNLYNSGQPDSQDTAFFLNNHPRQSHHSTNNFLSHPSQPFRGNRSHITSRRHSSRPYDFRRPGRGRANNPYSRECNYCGGLIHLYANCRNRIRDEQGRQSHAAEISSNLANYSQADLTGDQANKEDYSYQSLTHPVIRNDSFWYADSGATRHMTDQRSIIWNFKPIDSGAWYVSGIGDTRLSVLGQGDVNAVTTINGSQIPILIRGVLYIPKLGINLFSIGAAITDGVEAVFSNNEVLFYRNGTLELSGTWTGNTLYRLNITAKVAYEDKALSSSISLPMATWNERLAHVSMSTIFKMSSQNLVQGLNLKTERPDSKTVCIGCILGKMHRTPFPVGRTRATHIGS